VLAEKSVLASNEKVYLEDLEMSARIDTTVSEIARPLASVLFPDDPGYFVSRFAIVHDDVFAFLCETATEVKARVRIEETKKTVADRGLWYEEAVPAEAIFAGAVALLAPGSNRAPGVKLDDLNLSIVQIGGKSSVGRGLCRVVVAKCS